MPEECPICGDEHTQEAHGDPVIVMDTGRNTAEGDMHRAAELCRTLLEGDGLLKFKPDRAAFEDVRAAYSYIYHVGCMSYDEVTEEIRNEESKAVEHLTWLTDYKIPDIMYNAGYITEWDGEGNAFRVWRAIPENPTADEKG